MVTKQEQLEWLAKKIKDWPVSFGEFVVASSTDIGEWILSKNQFEFPYAITRDEWQQERNKMQKQNSSWHERGELPPVGCKCEFVMLEDADFYRGKYKLPDNGDVVNVVAHHHFYETGKDVAVFVWYDGESGRSATGTNVLFRPLRTEREKAIDEMAAILVGCEKYAITQNVATAASELLYDAGCRMVKP